MKISITESSGISLDGTEYERFDKLPGVRRVQKITTVTALQLQEPCELVVNVERPQFGETGDWILEAGPGDIYLVKDEVFRRLYRMTSE